MPQNAPTFNARHRGPAVRGDVYLYVLVCALVLGALSSCGPPERLSDIRLPGSPVLAVRANWGVVSDAYVALRTAASGDAGINGHLRAGSVVEIREKSGSPELWKGREDFWYRIGGESGEGWVFGTHLDLYDSRQRATNAARSIIDG